MRRIFIFTNNLEMGGVEKSLLDFIVQIKRNKDYNMKLFVLEKKGALKDDFEKHIEIEELNTLYFKLCSNAKNDLVKNIKVLNLIESLKIIFRKICNKITKADVFDIINKLDVMDDSCDIAICYQVPIHPLTVFVAEKVNAKTKLLWNHAELASVDKHIISRYKNVLCKYERIFSVSHDSNDNCKILLPEFNEKFDVFHNYIDVKSIIDRSCEETEEIFDSKVLNLLTVGRLSEDKGYDILIESARLLKQNGILFKWFIIGEGELRKLIEREINKYNLKNQVILLGKKYNPYKYMRKCDLYVQTSRFEGYGITTLEAKILKKMIITTKTSGIHEKFKNRENAIITGINSEEIFLAINDIIVNTNLKNKILKNINSQNYEIPNDFIKLYRIVDECE
ncbi:MAG: glycosyltransferase [Peptostreptococcaceae bacterium]